MNKNDKILITGAKGMVGPALVAELKRNGYDNFIAVGKTECDLMKEGQVNTLFNLIHPDYVFHLAARVGGIHANDVKSGEFIYQNLMIQCNVIEAARVHKVKKLIFCGSACIYPKSCPQPIKESYLLTGRLEKTNIGYALAKITGSVMCQLYRKQYGCNFITVMPTNLYGEGDNFHLTDSHVIPGLFNKFYNAKIKNEPTVEVWGTGIAKREFLYVGDFVKALIFLMNNYDDGSIINVGSGVDITIKDLANLIKSISGYEGAIVWDVNYPDGTRKRRLDVSKINELGWKTGTEFKEGLQKTYKWFVENYNSIRR